MHTATQVFVIAATLVACVFRVCVCCVLRMRAWPNLTSCLANLLLWRVYYSYCCSCVLLLPSWLFVFYFSTVHTHAHKVASTFHGCRFFVAAFMHARPAAILHTRNDWCLLPHSRLTCTVLRCGKFFLLLTIIWSLNGAICNYTALRCPPRSSHTPQPQRQPQPQ